MPLEAANRAAQGTWRSAKRSRDSELLSRPDTVVVMLRQCGFRPDQHLTTWATFGSRQRASAPESPAVLCHPLELEVVDRELVAVALGQTARFNRPEI
jgi:hypothetical protein